ncbi:helix-turn-helix domain-containing protein [Thermanaerosceptrum fracticalcis]|uniref:Helix-turn-helix domain-containing protein n=1 Tax=Thermanaerosceptrum fracticalcis TaxID=1712410 RepID=A0A7G6E1B4_THEFR|nr:helix-turn-helix transcriptional regulator [Thermanaerosceptrum fracticalcis]QNB45868.1 helix-turn-helix domain-containing protein [Thermanaerosceptrum fracticalcis]
MYRIAREAARISRDAAADALHIGCRTLADYESGKTMPPPDVVLGMSRLYKVPWLTQIYCRENCAIGAAYSYEVLNNINQDPVSVLLKLMGEMSEAQEVLQRMMILTINKNRREDFTPDEWDTFVTYLQEFFDVEHCIETFKIALGRWCDVAELIHQHNQKCWARGYIKKRKRPQECGQIKKT